MRRFYHIQTPFEVHYLDCKHISYLMPASRFARVKSVPSLFLLLMLCMLYVHAAAQDCESTHDAESTTVMDENLPLNPDAPSDEDIVLISPQRARASVRPGAKRELGHKINFQVKKISKC